MSDEPHALSPISRPSLASETEYEAICQAVMETERGRWFLSEYARRSRQGDTKVLLDAISRIEMRLRGESEPQSLDRLIDALTEMARALARMKGDIAAIRPAGEQQDLLDGEGATLDAITAAGERTTSDIIAATERIQELAWSMREQGLDAALCDQLDASAAAIHDACQLQDVTGQRTGKAIHTLRYIEERIGALGDLWDAVAGGPPPEAAAPLPDAGPEPETAQVGEPVGEAAVVDAQEGPTSEPVADGEEGASADDIAQAMLDLAPAAPEARAAPEAVAEAEAPTASSDLAPEAGGADPEAEAEATQVGIESAPEADAAEPPLVQPEADIPAAEPVAAEPASLADQAAVAAIAAVEAEAAPESVFSPPEAVAEFLAPEPTAELQATPEPLVFTTEAAAELPGEPPGQPPREDGVQSEPVEAAPAAEAAWPGAATEPVPQPEPDIVTAEPEHVPEFAAPESVAEWAQGDEAVRESVAAVLADFLAVVEPGAVESAAEPGAAESAAAKPAPSADDHVLADHGLGTSPPVAEAPALAERDALGDALSRALEQMAAEQAAHPETTTEAQASSEAVAAVEEPGAQDQPEPPAGDAGPSSKGEGEADAAAAAASEPAPPADAIEIVFLDPEIEPQASAVSYEIARKSPAEATAGPPPDPWDLPGWLSDPEPAEPAAAAPEEPAELSARASIVPALPPDTAVSEEKAAAQAEDVAAPVEQTTPSAEEAVAPVQEAAPRAEAEAPQAEETESVPQTTTISVVTLIEPPIVILAAPVWVEPDATPVVMRPAATIAVQLTRTEPEPEPPSVSHAAAADPRPAREEAFARTAPPDHDLTDFLFEPEPVVTAWSSIAPLAEPRLDSPAARPGPEAMQRGRTSVGPHLPPNPFVRAEAGFAPTAPERPAPERSEPERFASERSAPEPFVEDPHPAEQDFALEPMPTQVVLEPEPDRPTAAEAPEPVVAAEAPEPVATAVAEEPVLTAVAAEPAPTLTTQQEAAAPVTGDTPRSEARPSARGAADDPLAAIVGLTDEEKIALFG